MDPPVCFNLVPHNTQQIIFLTVSPAEGLVHSRLGRTGPHLLPPIPGYQPAVKRASRSGTRPPKPPRGIQPAICMSVAIVKHHQACQPHLPIVKHRALCPWPDAISREAAARIMSHQMYAVSLSNRFVPQSPIL